MKSRFWARRAGLVLAAGIVLLSVACGGGSQPGAAGARWSDTPNQTMLNQLPAYSGSRLVREWELTQDAETTHVREYAIPDQPEQATNAVTQFYRDWLLNNGWTEAQPRASFSAFTKGESRLIVGRVGPQLLESPPGSRVVSRADPPAGSSFFYTLEMTADWQGSAPR